MARLHIQTGLHLAVAALLLVSLADATCQDVTFVTRSEWQARSSKNWQGMQGPASYSIVHHTATSACTSLTACSARVRAIQTHHMDTNDWYDIGYNFLIGGDEKVYVGRGWGIRGAHAGSTYYNGNSIGIAVIGNYVNVLPSRRVLNVLQNLMDCSVEMGYLTWGYTLKGHRDVRATTCPGDELYDEIATWFQYW